MKHLFCTTFVFAVVFAFAFLLVSFLVSCLQTPVIIDWKRHARRVCFVGLSPDGKIIVTGSADGAVQIWDAESGEELQESEWHPNAVLYASLSPDGKTVIAVYLDGSSRIWIAEQ